jgi:hypothetical protein
MLTCLINRLGLHASGSGRICGDFIQQVNRNHEDSVTLCANVPIRPPQVRGKSMTWAQKNSLDGATG